MTSINNLINKYCPIFYFSKNETIFPTKFENIVKSSKLTINTNTIPNSELSENPNKIIINSQYSNLQNWERMNEENIGSYLDENVKLIPTVENKSGDIRIKSNPHSNDNELACILGDIQYNLSNSYIFLHYVAIYFNDNNNGNDYSLVTLKIKCDIIDDTTEVIKIKFNNDSLESVFIKSNVEGKNSGMWYDPNDITDRNFMQERENNRLIFYIAKNTHSTYPVIHTYDIKSNLSEEFSKSYEWDPISNLILLLTPEINLFGDIFKNFYKNSNYSSAKLYAYNGMLNNNKPSLIYRQELLHVTNYDSYFEILIPKEIEQSYISKTSKTLFLFFAQIGILSAFGGIYLYNNYFFKNSLEECKHLIQNGDFIGNLRDCFTTPVEYKGWYFLILHIILIISGVLSNISGLFN